jgi:hypothetical protein
MIEEPNRQGMRPVTRPFPPGWARRTAFVAALCGIFASSGCGGSRVKEDALHSRPSNVIERSAEKGPVKLTVRLGPREPRLSDLVEMDVEVEAPLGIEIKPLSFGQAVGDFLVRDFSERSPVGGATKTNRKLYHYQLEPVHAGKHVIRSVSIEFVDRRPNSEGGGEPSLVVTDPLELTVTSELGNEVPDLAKLEPMLPPRPVPQTAAIGWLAAGGAVVALAVAAFALMRRRRRRPVEVRRQTAEEIAQAALSQLLAENLPARGLVKEFYLRLTGIVRRYVEDTTGIRAPEQTTEEFLRDMRSHPAFPPERSVRLAEFLCAADLVKYAGQQPEEDQLGQAIELAHEFVNLEPSAEFATAGRTTS